MNDSRAVILASASPQRLQLMQQMGIDPDCIAANIDESRHSGESATAYVKRMAVEKCQRVMQLNKDIVGTGALFIGADTAIALDDLVFGKAADLDAAIATLSQLSGKTHRVLTGVSVASAETMQHCVCETLVQLKPLRQQDIVAYWESGEPQGKAGCYAIQGLGATFVQTISGSYSNVVGLPLYDTAELLRYYGYKLL